MKKTETAIFAMGCFWQPDEFFRTVPGVLATEVGYIGGSVEEPSYEQVCGHRTGHAEAVKITFDPSVVSYGKLLDLFWNNHDPTTLNRQGPDIGDQYRSAVFCADEDQRLEAVASRGRVAREKLWGDDPLVTEIVVAPQWWPAEQYHQKYLMKRGVTRCHLPTPPRGRA
ncbi:MAG TPA: peptide-methionine (S)-S-oxide reductase MsrA [bacterium]|nr:peptide-methionine (S)-S-oxide reductase MsrA [bacterium]